MAKVINSLQNELIKHLVRLRLQRECREEHRSVVIEGKKLINEVCHPENTIVLVASHPELIPQHLQHVETVLVSAEVMQKISGLQSPEGILAEVKMPEGNLQSGMKWILVFDGVNDPGNMGTLLRTSVALGWDAVILTPNCCDPFNEKALRSARGATFRIPLIHGSWDMLKPLLKKNKWQPLVADMQGKPIDQLAPSRQGALLVLSNEAQGASSEALELCEKVQIPMPGEMESLNVAVAGGILMYLLKRNTNA